MNSLKFLVAIKLKNEIEYCRHFNTFQMVGCIIIGLLLFTFHTFELEIEC